IVDEAQNLTPQAMEELRMLSNYQLETQALLQSFLVGQPEFRRMLESSEMQQLRQRVIAGCHISPMDMDETRGYVEHRLTHVGWKGDPRFEPDAYEALYEATDGIPRRINSVCDRLLLSGYLAGKHVFAREDVDEAAQEIRQETRTPASYVATAEPVNGDGASDASQTLSDALSGIDLSRFQLDPETANKASMLIASLQAGNLEERLARIERSNAATMAVLRHLLNAVRSPEANRKP
ncbi:MAG: ral secretion pathway protein, partial [Betaproteobacteria bacterium]